MECKQLSINESRPLQKLEILRFTEPVFQHVSKLVHEDDINLWDVVRETLLKLEELNNNLKKGDSA